MGIIKKSNNPTERPEANYTGAFGHWSASASRCLKAPNSDMHAQCMCLCVCASALALHSYPPMSCHRAAVLVTGVEKLDTLFDAQTNGRCASLLKRNHLDM